MAQHLEFMVYEVIDIILYLLSIRADDQVQLLANCAIFDVFLRSLNVKEILRGVLNPGLSIHFITFAQD